MSIPPAKGTIQFFQLIPNSMKFSSFPSFKLSCLKKRKNSKDSLSVPLQPQNL